MTFNLRFLPEVEEDLISGYSWYADKARGLREEFLRIFYASVNNLTRNPLLYQNVYGDLRRLLLRRFPYAIYYLINENEIIVFGLFHCARDPRTVRLTLSDRDI